MSSKNNDIIKAAKKIKNKDINNKGVFEKRCEHINDLVGLKNEELKEQIIADIVKGVPAFKEMAKIITEKNDAFLIGSLTASFKKREKHMISLLSTELRGLPVFVKPIAFEPNKIYIYDIMVPATEQLIEDNDRDPNKIAVEQFGIIKNTIPPEYKRNSISIRFESKIPYPIIRLFNRGGFWSVWRVSQDIKGFNEFWSEDICGTMYQDVQPFIGTDKYEYAMLLNEKLYKSEFDTLMGTLKENIEEKHSLKLEDTFTLSISYGWLVRFGIPKEILKKGKIEDVLSTLARRIPIIGRGIPSAYLGEEKLEYDTAARIISEPTFKGLRGFVYSDKIRKKCSYTEGR